MAVYKMGYKGPVYYGAAGGTAATLITNRVDANYTFDIEEGNTTVAGDGTAVPIETTAVTCRKYSVELTMLEISTDSTFSALRAAAVAGTPVAIKTDDFDGDCILSMKKGDPLKGERTVTFTAKPTYYSRAPQLS